MEIILIDLKNQQLQIEGKELIINHGIVPQCCSQCGELVGIPRLSSRSDM